MKLKDNISSTYSLENGDFWYDLTKGGYCNPKDFLDKEDAAKVEAAITIIEKFESLLETLEDEEDDY